MNGVSGEQNFKTGIYVEFTASATCDGHEPHFRNSVNALYRQLSQI